MGTVIYSASPFQAILGGIGTGLLLVAIGAVGLLVALLRRNQGRGSRIVLGVAGVVLLCAGTSAIAISVVSVSAGARTVAVLLDDKQIVEQSCGDDGSSTCTSYMLETSNRSGAFDFQVPLSAYDLAQPETCYLVSYLPRRSLFGSGTPGYQRISSVTRIEVADPARCQ